ncbi:RNA-directed DNA polymerase, eukaryota, reverse transcriptase zinc-binding domain protein [Tanacetum coccineum]
MTRVSDHCPVMLHVVRLDFGLKCFKLFDHWIGDVEFHKIVQSSWNSKMCNGSADIVLKNKLKPLKANIKTWCHFKKVEQTRKKARIKNRLLEWDVKAEMWNLTDSDIWKRDKDRMDLQLLERLNESLLSRKKDDPMVIKSTAFEYFFGRYKESSHHLPRFHSDLFLKFDINEAGNLEAEFTMDELKEAVWSCSSIKSSGPDGFNFKQILDGIIVSNENVNYAKKEGINLLLLKVDFEKAFDSINWIFLLGVMKQMSFGAKWCSWIYACLSSASVSILVNGSPTTEFKMEHGIRQGDTLSLFIFLIVSEALQVMVIEAHNKGIFNDFSLADNGANISLLQYADDVLLPVGKDMRKSANLNGGIDRFSKKLSIWKVNLLSIGGRLTLIKSEAILLGVKANKRKIMWIRWEHIIIDKKNGGLGIGSTKAKNMSLLGKWKWRFLSEPHVLWNKCIKEIHGYNGGFDSGLGYGSCSSV